MLIVAGVGLWGRTAGSAMPVNGPALVRVASAGSLLTPAYYVHRHGRTCYRKCYHEWFFGPRVCRTFC
jgi:hypothetical protein